MLSPREAVMMLLALSVVGLIFWVGVLRLKVRRLESFRRDFVANISHEFRTPLTVIHGYTDTLVEKSIPPETARSFLLLIQTYTARLMGMVEKVLELSRLENISPRRQSSFISLADFFEQCRQRFLPRLQEKQLSWQVTLLSPLGHIETDLDLLEMIVNNLIDNAIKYSLSGGSVRASAERHGKAVRFCVEDNGIGIPLELQRRIFERFYRAPQVGGDPSTGSGLGLAIVKHAVQSLGGKVWVESGPGRGASFYFTL